MDFSLLARFSYCVIGDPIDHSLSPVMQNAAFSALQMGAPYGKMQVHREEMDAFFSYARTHLKGVNVTVPLKEEAALRVDELGKFAAATRSVNTLKISEGHIFGDSTDGVGILRALEETLNFTAFGKTILFLGAGGAARAASFALAFEGARAIAFLNRSRERAEALANELQTQFPALCVAAATFDDRAAVKRLFSDAELVIQSTSLGWHDDDPQVLEIPETQATFFDLVYRDTKFLRTAHSRHLRAGNGSSMLLYQGAASFELWTGKKAPLDAMRRALELK